MFDEHRTKNNKQDILVLKAELFAHEAYKLTRQLPKDELFGLSSQIKRAALSVPLNIVEGYGRQSKKSEAHFLTIAYASLKETIFAINFAIDERLINSQDVASCFSIGDELGALIWKKTHALKSQLDD